MKEKLRFWLAKVDALSLRERLMIFAASLAVLFGLLNFTLLQSMQAKQKHLTQQLKEAQLKIVANGDEIAAKLRANSLDPDAVSRSRLQEVRAQTVAIQNELRNQQKGLVPANKIAPLLNSLLKNHANVQLQALRTLSPQVIGPANLATAATAVSASAESSSADTLANEKAMKEKSTPASAAASSPIAVVASALSGASASASASASPSVATPAATAQIFKHEVEIVLAGNYLDLLAVLQEMEKLPWQLYWAKASLRTEQYPQSTLTLRVFTLSLDQIWLDL